MPRVKEEFEIVFERGSKAYRMNWPAWFIQSMEWNKTIEKTGKARLKYKIDPARGEITFRLNTAPELKYHLNLAHYYSTRNRRKYEEILRKQKEMGFALIPDEKSREYLYVDSDEGAMGIDIVELKGQLQDLQARLKMRENDLAIIPNDGESKKPLKDEIAGLRRDIRNLRAQIQAKEKVLSKVRRSKQRKVSS